MQLVLNSPGIFLSQSDGLFYLKKKEKSLKIAPNQIDSIVISNKVSMTSQAIVLANEYNIDLLILDHWGHPIGRFWYITMGRNAKIRKSQIQLAETTNAIELALPWLQNKLLNEIKFLKKLQATRRSSLFSTTIDLIEELKDKMVLIPGDYETQRNHLMGLEGAAARAYFRSISSILPKKYQFQKRTRRPAKEPFNAALNYAFGVLYSHIEKACLLAGLDIHVGLLHSLDPYHPALVFDLIEPFRIWAERTVVYLFTKKQLNDSHFEFHPDSVFLNEKGKEVLIPALNRFMEEKIRYRKHNIQRKKLPLHYAHLLANQLISDASIDENWMYEIQEF